MRCLADSEFGQSKGPWKFVVQKRFSHDSWRLLGERDELQFTGADREPTP